MGDVKQWEGVGLDRDILLAKSIIEEHSDADLWAMRLPGHLEQGILAAEAMEPIAHIVCDRLNLTDCTASELVQSVKLAIWLHDWGKVNQSFLAMVEGNSKKILLKRIGITRFFSVPKQQLIRHELLSCILVQEPQVRKWLQPYNKFLPVALLAVLSHHLKVRNANYFNLDLAVTVNLFTDSPDFLEVLKLGVKYFGLSNNLPSIRRTFGYSQESQLHELMQSIKDFKQWLDIIENNCKDNTVKLTRIAAIKALTMSCDLAASALLEKNRSNCSYNQWITEALSQTMTSDVCEQIIINKLDGKQLFDFQKQAAKSKHRVVIVVAGCGGGKSLVAYTRLKQLADKGLKAKLFFCYPTTSTTTQGFIDYSADKLENTLLEHSRKWVDEQLRGFSRFYDNEDGGADINNEEAIRTRVEALQMWHSKLIYCTAHTVLGLLQNHRKGLYGFPAIIQGFFVFDEIHAYPPELFNTLLRFLKIFRNSNIVLMTASLPPCRQRAIESILKENGETPDIISGHPELETIPRYNLTLINTESDILWQEVIREIKINKGRVLWITNEVHDCQRLYLEAKQRITDAGLANKIELICFHSRFKYQDSINKQEKLVNAFRGNKPIIAITTQIAEMSLDISCTLLVSAIAPLWALTQRLGRLNRWVDFNGDGSVKLRTNRVCKALIYERDRPYPYTTKEDKKGLELARQMLSQYANKDINQSILSEFISKMEATEISDNSITWLHPWLTRQGKLMSASNTTQVILENDIPAIFDAVNNGSARLSQEVQKWLVSIRMPKDYESWEVKKCFKYYRVAPLDRIHYNLEIGAYEAGKF